MFHVLTLTYTQPPAAVDASRPAHLAWLQQEVDAGRVILSGRQESGRGGVLITSDISTAEAEDIMASDPYQLAGLVDYQRVSITAGARAAGL